MRGGARDTAHPLPGGRPPRRRPKHVHPRSAPPPRFALATLLASTAQPGLSRFSEPRGPQAYVSLHGRAGAILAEMQELSKAEELLRQSVRLLEVRGAPPAAPHATKVAAATTKLEAG